MTGPVLVLVGPPGAGKTTVGRLLARRLGVSFRDTDADVEAAAGQSVSDIFIGSGEPRFRALERAAVKAALAEHTGVLAVGGGAVLDEGTRAELRRGLVRERECEGRRRQVRQRQLGGVARDRQDDRNQPVGGG